jgi:hypothetical protein
MLGLSTTTLVDTSGVPSLLATRKVQMVDTPETDMPCGRAGGGAGMGRMGTGVNSSQSSHLADYLLITRSFSLLKHTPIATSSWFLLVANTHDSAVPDSLQWGQFLSVRIYGILARMLKLILYECQLVTF